MNNASPTPINYWPSTPLLPTKPSWKGLRGRQIVMNDEKSWTDMVIQEWSLEQAGWEDYHPHDETNIVLEGELHIEVDGVNKILRVGDTARVNAGRLGKYYAPGFARMIVIYGPNPDGRESSSFRYWDIKRDGEPGESLT